MIRRRYLRREHQDVRRYERQQGPQERPRDRCQRWLLLHDHVLQADGGNVCRYAVKFLNSIGKVSWAGFEPVELPTVMAEK